MSLKKDTTIKRVSRKVIADNRGVLMPFNLEDVQLNSFKRVFCTADLKKGEARGSHAHHSQTQLLFVIQGEFKITFENSREKGEILLNNHSEGIEIPNMTWSTQTPTMDNSVLMVFASDVYEERDYIRDYQEFQRLSNWNIK
jgi:dTDP-4-dehydrorhamnose 3,5-epimerase-like enzyme